MKNDVNPIRRNDEYDPFAASYNRNWGADYRAEAVPIVERLLLSRLKPGASVLDVCCGTGQFTREIAKQGYEVAGLDASGEMIRFAKENAPGIPFTVADAREFELGRKFHGAYSVFESLNHVPDLDGLGMAFLCVRRHLEPKGAFLFDLNREEAFQLYWNSTDALVDPDHVMAMRSTYNEDSRLATCEMTVFEPDGKSKWTRRDFTVHQTFHEIADVQQALLAAGFKDVSLVDAFDAGMKGAAGHARTFFLATA